jgi:acetoacetyl-CoA synthetase
MTDLGTYIWKPSAKRWQKSQLCRYLEFLKKQKLRFESYQDLHAWSVSDVAKFWESVAAFCEIRWQTPPTRIYTPPTTEQMLGARWFEGAALNFAENLLMAAAEDKSLITSYAEGAAPRRLSTQELKHQVARCAAALKAAGVEKGDRVAGVLANIPEALVGMLATASLGAVWSSCSPDFGVAGILDRLRQVEPKVLFFSASYQYGGKVFDCLATMHACAKALSSVSKLVAVTHLGSAPTGVVRWQDFLGTKEQPLTFTPVAFDHPLYILFSSGTTGIPKCIVHTTGGTLLQHKKELMLHSDIAEGSNLLFFTTCGWMMWNWMASAVSTGARLTLFEGSPIHPSPSHLWEVVANEKVTAFGTSPRFISAAMKAQLNPAGTFNYDCLQTILSTGSPLLPEHFQWIYQQFPDVHLASISGGTDIVSCFMLGNLMQPVYSGEIQGPGLGMALAAWCEDGEAVASGAKGELVCTKPFPVMPVGFWKDADNSKYREAYFNYYPRSQVWRHGDYVSFTEHGGVVVYGRSDSTLNPGGVRIGTAEIYRCLETASEVQDSIAVAFKANGDESIILFVQLAPKLTMTTELAAQLKKKMKQELSPRHVPAHILQVSIIPYTRSGKKVEQAASDAMHGDEVKNITAIANPDCLEEYRVWGESQTAARSTRRKGCKSCCESRSTRCTRSRIVGRADVCISTF